MEDPLPAYDVLPMNDDGVPKDDNEPVRGAGHPGRPITSSLRATYRLLRSTGSWRASFRGLGYATVLAILTLVTVLFISLLPFVSDSIQSALALNNHGVAISYEAHLGGKCIGSGTVLESYELGNGAC